MANVWMHNGFLQVEGRKMSKSEGNFVTINELLQTEKFGGRKWPGEVLRLAMLMTHYREPIDFSVKRLEEAERLLERWRAAVSELSADFLDPIPDDTVFAALSDDLNFSKTLYRLHELSDLARDEPASCIALARSLVFLGLLPSYSKMIAAFKALSDSIEITTKHLAPHATVGDLLKAEETHLAPTELNEKIENRLALLAAKNFAEADKIRDDLLAQGIQLKDGKDPVTGERVTTWEVKR